MLKKQGTGLFWFDEPKIKSTKKESEKRLPPEPIWLKPDYLPDLDQALSYVYNVMTDEELIRASLDEGLVGKKHVLIFDVECYINYFLVMFYSVSMNKYLIFESYNDSPIDLNKLSWVMDKFTIVGFNSNNYDICMVTLALKGLPNATLKQASNMIIDNGMRSSDVLTEFNVERLFIDTIDLMELPIGKASLKIYAARLNAKRIKDLPFAPDSTLTNDQAVIMLWYCHDDLDSTLCLFLELLPAIELREKMSKEYRTDLRSKSDAQIAESVIGNGIKNITGVWPEKVDTNKIAGASFKYKIPDFISFKTDKLKNVLNTVYESSFNIASNGRVQLPKDIANLYIDIGQSIYRMGIGGLHSSEENIGHTATDNMLLIDTDVAAYYPNIILNQRLFPKQLGEVFLKIYQGIVEKRLEAKKFKNKLVDASLKIVINGSFGKLGSQYSILYSPELLIQVTITGQLSLLMLIESLELFGIEVVSANTDGIVSKCPLYKYDTFKQIIEDWETQTNFTMEETRYKALYSRDVNSYMAIKLDNSVKRKGAYSDTGISKNPNTTICTRAVTEYLTNGIPIEQTIIESKDITEFISVRAVRGGGVKIWNNTTEYLGKAIRWYYARDIEGDIIYAKSGNKVARTEGAKPIMLLPDEFPNDIYYEWYIAESYKILKEIGFNSFNS